MYSLVVALLLAVSPALAADPPLPTAKEVLSHIDQNMTFESRVMTSMVEELGVGVAMADVQRRLAVELARVLDRRLL